MITKSKEDTVHSRRTVFSYLQDKYAVTELFRNIAVKIADRPGGYTRILKTGNRLGDNADMCLIELVDFNELLLKEKDSKKVKTTRRSRSKKSTEEETEVVKVKKTAKVTKKVEEVEEPVADAVVIEEPTTDDVITEQPEEKAEENNEAEEEKK